MNSSLRTATVLLLVTGIAACEKPAPASGVATTPAQTTEAPTGIASKIAGGIEKVTVQVTAQGPTLQAAVDAAIRLAIEQVNGKTMNASNESYQAGMVVTVGAESLDVASAGFASYVETHSKGAITGFRIVSQSVLPDNRGMEVTIEAKVAKYVAPESANRLAIVVAPFRANGGYVLDTQSQNGKALAANLRETITNALVKSNRFAVVDREFSDEIDQELGLIADGQAGPDDYARLGQQISAQYLLLGQIDRFAYARHEQALRTSDRVLVSHSGGGALTLKLINVTTRQLEWADTVAVTLPSTEPSTMSSGVNVGRLRGELLAELSALAMSKVVTHLFPITIVSLQGDQAILSQGSTAVSVGTSYRVVSLGAELKDPQTGQSLGRVENQCCAATVTQVTPTIAYARLTGDLAAITGQFKPGNLQLREVVSIERREQAAAQTPASASVQVEAPDAVKPKVKKAAAATAAEESESDATKPDQDKDW